MAKILVVDDAAVVRLRTSKVLVAAGHEVLEAQNGRQAVEVYEREHPDAVFLDLTMPEMGGLEALEAIRRRHPAARVAMVSALGDSQHVMDAVRLGASDFVVKPFQADRILTALARLLPGSPGAPQDTTT